MLKQIALAATLIVATAGITTTTTTEANAGYGHRYHHGFGLKFHKGYVYHSYRPVYRKRYYKPVCSHYGWKWHKGHKVWGCRYW